MSDFFVTLPSNTKVTGNTVAEFRCTLACPVSLEGQWEVGLASIQYPSTWENIPKTTMELEVMRWSEDEERVGVDVVIPSGRYGRVEDYLDEVNARVEVGWYKMMRAWAKDKDEDTKYRASASFKPEVFHMSFNGSRVQLEYMPGIFPNLKLGKALSSMLGWGGEMVASTPSYSTSVVRADQSTTSIVVTAPDYPAFSASLSSLYVYTDIIEPQLVGDAMVKLLKIVPARATNEEFVNIEFQNVHYVNVLSNHFSDIEISIKGDTGDPFPFIGGCKSIVVLHFKRKRLVR